MKAKYYYTYLHIRPDTQEVFYVGIGSDYPGRYSRAYAFSKRNQLWKRIWHKNNKQIIVQIVNVFESSKECLAEEVSLIEYYGRKCKNQGTLANVARGGEHKAGDPKPVAEYSLKGQLIKVWENAVVASRVYNISEKAIYAGISKKRPCNGSFWIWADQSVQEQIEPFHVKSRGAKQVFYFDKDCNCLGKHNSVHAAEKEMEISKSSIFKVIAKTRPTAGGYIWSYDKNDCSAFNHGQWIYQYSMSKELVEKYSSLNEAVRRLSLPSSTAIRNCFQGKQKQAYGFIWTKEPISQHRI